jgi:hypothetical protein
VQLCVALGAVGAGSIDCMADRLLLFLEFGVFVKDRAELRSAACAMGSSQGTGNCESIVQAGVCMCDSAPNTRMKLGFE